MKPTYLRNEFALKAMESLILTHPAGYWWMTSNYTLLAKYSYRIADAMLREELKRSA